MGSVLRVFDLSFGQMLWSRRSALLALAALGPFGLAVLIRAIVGLTTVGSPGPAGALMRDGATLFGMMIWLLYVRFIVPMLGVFYGTSLIADEVDDKTITYLFTRPIRRSSIVLGKYLAYVVCALLLVLPSVVLVYFITVPIGGSPLGAEFPALLKDLGMLAVALMGYGAVFALVGTRVKRPLVAGLVFAFGWEPAVLVFPGYLKRLTIAYYVQGLVPHPIPQDPTGGLLGQFFAEIPAAWSSLAWLLLLTLVALWAAARTVENREYVLEQ
jgi:ABC-type transport system involved in multi-copper enzyme maturation permease subunit